MSKKKTGSPLQAWRSQYNYMSSQLRAIKQSARNGGNWGGYKISRQQSLIPAMKAQATELMGRRVSAAEEARRLSRESSWPKNRYETFA
jgi:hypothetical protein